jgi:lipoate-protein ligase A
MEAPGAVQMAIDHWLLTQHQLGRSPSVLRFYTWSPPAISLGYHQHRWPQAWHHLSWQGQPVDLVRRPSGGRAVLHQGDLTYAVITSGLAGNRTQAYQTLCEFLIEGWRSLGVPLNYGQGGRGYIQNPNCFETATTADLVLPDGSKLIGSAQFRHKNSILQHGSMRLQPDADLFRQVFGTPIAFSGCPVMGYKDPVTTLVDALATAACHCYGIQLVVQPLTAAEYQAAIAEVAAFEVPNLRSPLIGQATATQGDKPLLP